MIAPHYGAAASALVRAENFNSILVLLFDFVVDNEGRVVLDGYPTLV